MTTVRDYAVQARDAFLRLSAHNRFRILFLLSFIPAWFDLIGLFLLWWLGLIAWLYIRAFPEAMQ